MVRAGTQLSPSQGKGGSRHEQTAWRGVRKDPPQPSRDCAADRLGQEMMTLSHLQPGGWLSTGLAWPQCGRHQLPWGEFQWAERAMWDQCPPTNTLHRRGQAGASLASPVNPQRLMAMGPIDLA